MTRADEKLIRRIKPSRAARGGMPSPATVPGRETGAEPAEGHSQREAAGDGQLVAPLDGPILLPLDPRDGSGRLLRGYFIPVERKLLAAERSRASAVWVVTRPSGSAKRERAEHGRAGKDTTPRKKNTHRGKTLQETVKKFRADVNPASSSSCLATQSRGCILRANMVNGAQILHHTARAHSPYW